MSIYVVKCSECEYENEVLHRTEDSFNYSATCPECGGVTHLKVTSHINETNNTV